MEQKYSCRTVEEIPVTDYLFMQYFFWFYESSSENSVASSYSDSFS